MLKELIPNGPVSGVVAIPGSKYQANRALILAALADGPSRIYPLPANDDIDRVQIGLQVLGLTLTLTPAEQAVTVHGLGAGLAQALPAATLAANASGTFARFAMALASLGSKPIVIDGSARLRMRPMQDLATALRALGVNVRAGDDGLSDALPLTITGPLRGGVCELPGHISSQFISALLMVAPLAQRDVEIVLTTPLVSKDYVAMTIAMMAERGVQVQRSARGFFIAAGQSYQAGDIILEADPCSASYFMAAAALTGGDILLPGFNLDSLQGEAQFVRVLEQMGCLIKREAGGLRVQGPGLGLRAVDVDMGDMPDVVQTLAVLAAFAKGVTRLRNIAHLIHKESNRIFDTALELKKMGVNVEASADALIIEGGCPHGAAIETHDDHRMAMSFAIAGLKIPGVKILDAEVCAKSFPQFWQCLASLGVQECDTGNLRSGEAQHGR